LLFSLFILCLIHVCFFFVYKTEWMAPDVVMMDEYGKEVDVFSFGIVLTGN